MFARFLFLFFLAYLHQADSLKAPSYFKLCPRSDPKVNECIKKNGQETLPSLIKGDRKYKIPNLNPLVLPQLKINQGPNLNIDLKNCKVGGLKDTIVEDANFDFKNKKISMGFTIPLLTMDSDYEISGRILILPITGKGPAHLAMNDVKFTYVFDYDVINKGGIDYMKPKKGSIKYTTKKLNLNFENLFNGDKVLGAETNNFLNENWREVERELGPGIAEALAEVIYLIINNVTEMVPFDELFPENL